jgi:hypothetical protein
MMIAKVHGGDNPAPLGIPQAVGLVNSSSIQPAIQGQFNAASLQLLLPNEDLLKTHPPLLEPEFMTKPQVTSLCIHCDSATGRPHPGLPVGRCCDYRGYRDGCSSPGEFTERKKEEEKGNGLSSPICPSCPPQPPVVVLPPLTWDASQHDDLADIPKRNGTAYFFYQNNNENRNKVYTPTTKPSR